MNILKHIQILILVLAPACLMGAAQSPADYFDFPKPTGKYAVGTRLIELTDESRLESTKGEPAKFRRLPVQVWYPAEGKLDKPTSPYAYEMLKNLKKMCAEDDMPQAQIDQLDLIRTYAVTDAQISKDQAAFPVVIFAHGYATSRGEYSSICEDIASHGYIVFTVWQTYLTSITRFADGTETEFVREKSPDMFEDCSADIEFMLNQVQAGVFKELTQSCDFANIGIVGHSLGGMMANHICRSDVRVKAGISLDGPLYGPRATEPFNKPFMFMLAPTFYHMFDDEEIMIFTGMTKEEFASSIDKFCHGNEAPWYKIILKNAEHCTFSDCPILVNVLKQITGSDDIHLGAGTIDGLKAIEIIRSHICSFFDKYLKGQPAPLIDGQDKKYAADIEFKSWAQ
ncbi:MAG: Platelet-activating factor acetylhydrolase plasma/intracellular isoform II [candidate division TM6 bacterium GW2011_GWF2_37_49]|nr:MAG: Platelet-activating factor acetylhydrolase plasma/intracellular isoform II [candidate division TM6 bacterium GW2011_GWF2_37_49]